MTGISEGGSFVLFSIYYEALCPYAKRWRGTEAGGSNMAEKNIMTRAGLKKIEDELDYLKLVKRKEVAEKLKEARAQGDLSENAEFDAARDEQRDVAARIETLEKLLKNVEVVDEEEVTNEFISIGCQVLVHDEEFDEDMEFHIVGSTEANSLQGKISNESPVGKALMGKKAGDVIQVETQAGISTFQVLEIRKA